MVRLEAEDNHFRLSVFNSGSYISTTDVEAIFERFYQVDGHQAGTGIGLAWCVLLWKCMAAISWRTAMRKELLSTVTLPKRDISQYHPAVPALAADEKEISSTLVDAEIQAGDEALEEDCPIVLVIDDNADIRHYVKSLLVKEFRVLDAAEWATGIRLAMKYVPDVIVSDVMMPGMDGIECCRRLKGELQTCHIPVILLTACSLDEHAYSRL